MSIFTLINLLIRKWSATREYQGGDLNPKSSIEHIASGLVFSLLASVIISKAVCLGVLFLVLIWTYYAPIKELIIDRYKNAGMPRKFTYVQILERSIGFIVGLPINIIGYIL